MRIKILLCLCFLASSLYAQENKEVKKDVKEGENIKEAVLAEVVVIGDSIFHYPDKDVYRITKHMRKGSYNTAQMLDKVPGISYNYATKSLSYLGNKNIIILVDSIEKDAEYIKNLRHIRFSKVEVIQNPKGKYESYDAIINLRRKTDYEGYENNLFGNVDFYPSDRNGKGKSFGNTEWSESFTYTKNKWNAMLYYYGDFNQGERNTFLTRRYLSNDYMETVVANADNSHNQGYMGRENTVGVSLDYQFNKRNSISLAYFVEFTDNDDFSHRTVIGSDLQGGNANTFYSRSKDKDKGNRQGAAIFFRGGMDAWNYNSTLNYIRRSWDTNSLLSRSTGYYNQDDRHQIMDHVFGDMDINRRFLNKKLYVSASYNFFWKRYDQFRLGNNDILSKNTLQYHYFGTYLSYEFPHHLSVHVSGNVRRYIAKTPSLRDSYMGYSGSVGLFKKIGKHSWTRIDYSSTLNNPSQDKTSLYEYFTDSLTKRVGNPLLRTSLRHNLSLKVNIMEAITLKAGMNYSPRDFAYIRSLEYGNLQNGKQANYILSTYQNGENRSWWVSMNFNSNVGKFNIDANVGYKHRKAQYESFNNSNGGWTGSAQVSYMWYKKKMYAYLSYTHDNLYNAEAQSWGTNYHDFLGVTLIKSLFKEKLQIQLTYTLPFSFTSEENRNYIASPGYEYYSCQSSKDIIHNSINLTVSFRIDGGKSVRQYDHEMSKER